MRVFLRCPTCGKYMQSSDQATRTGEVVTICTDGNHVREVFAAGTIFEVFCHNCKRLIPTVAFVATDPN
jgi:hypothetical protein